MFVLGLFIVVEEAEGGEGGLGGVGVGFLGFAAFSEGFWEFSEDGCR